MAEKLLKQRTVCKGYITRMANKLKAETESDQTFTSSNLKIKQSLLKDNYNKYLLIQEKLIEIDLEHDNDRDETEEQYVALVGKLTELIEQLEHEKSLKILNSTHESLEPTKTNNFASLPKLQIPKFKGDYLEWNSFKDIYHSAIHMNQNIPKVQKFQHLKTLLSNEPLSLIESLSTTEDNYEIAWNLLEKRYSNKIIVANCHIKSILEFKPIPRGNTYQLRELIVNTKKHVQSLENIGLPVAQWDVILVYILSTKLDEGSLIAYERNKNINELPILNDMLEFLESHCGSLEKVTDFRHSEKISRRVTSNVASSARIKQARESSKTFVAKCYFCASTNHGLYTCDKFKSLNVEAKFKFIKENNRCVNCFRAHNVRQCWAQNCTVCNQKHNTLLCQQGSSTANHNSQNSKTIKPMESTTIERESSQSYFTNFNSTSCETLLPTAIVMISDDKNRLVKARALLDSASQNSFITSQLVSRLKLPTYEQHIQVSGISAASVKTTRVVEINVHSNVHNFKMKVNCAVLNRITDKLPHSQLSLGNTSLPERVSNQLADPNYLSPMGIDILLGVDVFFTILKPSKISLGHGLPHLQNSLLGYLVGGTAPQFCPSFLTSKTSLHVVSHELNELQHLLPKFWNIEEVKPIKPLTQEEVRCEELFKKTIVRLPSGQFEVELPFDKDPKLHLGDSITQALSRFFRLERRLIKDPNLYDSYRQFIREYVSLGHAKVVDFDFQKINKVENGSEMYFCPHHPVVNYEKQTTKVRVVFDGSCKTSNNCSLNDLMFVGATVHPELFDCILRFRLHKFVFTADIQKMYRMIRINENHQRYQRIVWRDNPNEELKCIQLCTVTYGFSSSPFLATRALKELALSDGHLFPIAKEAILNNCYVDDFLCGKSSLEELQDLRQQLVSLLSLAKLQLHKWHSNCQELGENNNQDENDSVFSALGLSWNPAQDQFVLRLDSMCDEKALSVSSKREVLSYIAKLFDPLGLIAPIIIVAKMLMQDIWVSRIDWDDKLPSELQVKWAEFVNDIRKCKEITIPRWCYFHISATEVELHGFCDASTRAYGACVYLKCRYSDGKVFSRLLTSKSRVCPIKTLTIPRLELCSAVLLARLMDRVRRSLHINIDSIILHSDSKIVLAWIVSPATKFNVFVGHRISEIQELTSDCVWHHVSTKENPADLISRGLDAGSLVNSSLWWEGPVKLISNTLEFNRPITNVLENLPEERVKRSTVLVTRVGSEIPPSWNFHRFSKLNRLKRTYAYILRFLSNSRNSDNRISSELTSAELQKAYTTIIKLVQIESFTKEIEILKSDRNEEDDLLKQTKIYNLNPFLDHSGCLRVGGRLQEATNLSYNQKHPLILPSDHHVTELIIRHEHEELFHAGTSTLLAHLRNQFWPLNAKNKIKAVLKRCIVCCKLKKQTYNQIMGNLPADRITVCRPFEIVGIDYAGPFMIKNSLLKRSQLSKAYLSLFVCFNTKAIHIELVSSLNTEDFLAALKRFIARRGVPTKIFSDNGSQFKSASAKLHDLYLRFNKSEANKNIFDFVASKGIEWKFIPPLSPSMGGLWERAIQSVKYYLKRVVGNQNLSFEQLSTCLIQIESIVNSRPLCEMSNDIDDYSYLSPNHFLLGASADAIPEENLIGIPENRLRMWNLISQIKQHFWKRWSNEYLHQLQERSKWRKKTANIKLGALVILKEDNLPPLQWTMGRIVELFPGKDEKVRVVNVKTKSGIYLRSIHKLCPLPVDT